MTFRCETSRSSSPTVSTDPAGRPAGPVRRMATWLTAGWCALSLAGCVSVAGGPSPTDPHLTTTTVAPTTTVNVDLEEGLANFRHCLAEAGIAIGEIQLDGRGRPWLSRALSELDLHDRLMVSALGDCAPELATGALDLTADHEMHDAVMSGLAGFASCLRANGVPEFPDPSPRFTGVGSPFPDGLIPWGDDDLATAVIICNRALAEGS